MAPRQAKHEAEQLAKVKATLKGKIEELAMMQSTLKKNEQLAAKQEQLSVQRQQEATAMHQRLDAMVQQLGIVQLEHGKHVDLLKEVTAKREAMAENMQKQNQAHKDEVQRLKEETTVMSNLLTQKNQELIKLEKDSQEQLQYLEKRLRNAQQQQEKEIKQNNDALRAAQEHRDRLHEIVVQKQRELDAQKDKLAEYEKKARNLNQSIFLLNS